jgi:hypothetical protein
MSKNLNSFAYLLEIFYPNLNYLELSTDDEFVYRNLFDQFHEELASNTVLNKAIPFKKNK